ncbi:MAG: hypothetical protein K1X79_07640 [Oligoflexia bacterium]|nr:hypothetical protein [Oligoflexia bacterium]
MRIIFTLSVILLSAFVCLSLPAAAYSQTCASNELGGVVFQDYDADGSQGTYEPGESGISVLAYSSAGTTLASTTTASDGTYVLTGITSGTSVRIEFSGLPSEFKFGPAATSAAGTAVRFATTDGTCNINLGLSYPFHYCQSDPRVLTPRHVNGDGTLSGSSSTEQALVSFLSEDEGQPPSVNAASPKQVALNSEIGATWGVAYQRASHSVFASALMKRHAAFGPLGTGGIYRIDVTDEDNPVVTSFIDVDTLGISTGTDSHSGLPADITTPNFDAAAYADVGKVGIGDLDISEDDDTLWFVNLHDRTLYSMYIGLTPSTPSSADLTDFPIPDPGCSNSDYRPWGIGINRGRVYVGVVCSAETSQSAADLHAYILRLKSDGSGFDTVLDFPLSYTRGSIIHPAFNQKPGPDEWQAWTQNEASMGLGSVSNFDFIVYTQPILMDIEFDIDDSMIIGFGDRSGHQLGRYNYLPTQAVLINPPSGGDVLRACSVGSGVWSLESNGTCGGVTTGGAGNSEGPGGGEYYYEDVIEAAPSINAHNELFLGALAMHYGTGNVIQTAYDPFIYETQGAITSSNSSGTRVRGYEVVGDFLGNFGKAAGLGDLELICDPAPLQIGNRVWIDTDKDGEQDAGETPVSGVTVNLYNSGNTLVATTTTDSSGEYLFSGLSANTSYCIRLDNASDYQTGGALSRYTLTSANAVADQKDSDGVLNNSYPEICPTTSVAGDNVHTYDFGFITACSQTSLLPSALILDSNALALRNLARRTLRYINQQAQRHGGCSSLTASQRSEQLNIANSNYQSLWTRVWSLGTSHYTCSVVPNACSETDITDTISEMRTEITRLYNATYRGLRGACMRNRPTSIAYLRWARHFRNRAYYELNTYPSSLRDCQF